MAAGSMKLWTQVVLVWAGCLSILSAGSDRLLASENNSPSLPRPLVTDIPAVAAIIPEPGTTIRQLDYLEVDFTEPVTGVDAADLLINGISATNVDQTAPGQYIFTFVAPLPGTVKVTWSSDHGIRDAETMTRAFSGGDWTYALDPTAPATGVMISEFMAENRLTLKDEDNDTSDWIELFNSGDEPADLEGWYLTDQTNRLTQWRFPAVVMPPKSYLVVYASEKNKTNVNGRLHTNFKLGTDGEYLALIDSRTNVVSEFSPRYEPQRADVSYGRAEGDSDTIGFFASPTPGAPNATQGPGFASGVRFSRSSQSFAKSFSLELRCTDADAEVHYTVDGSIPTLSAPWYQGPLLITNSVVIRARAFRPGWLPGPVRTEAFWLMTSSMAEFNSDLPVLIFHTFGKSTVTSSRPSYAQLFVYEPRAGRTSFDQPPDLATRTGIQTRGSSTEFYSKPSYKLELWDEYNLDRHLTFLGMPAESDWVLYAPNNYEPVLIHNPFVHQLSRDMGQYSPRTRFVEVFFAKSVGAVTTNHYAGIYVVEEKIKISPQRVAIDRLSPTDVLSPELSGGYMLKIDRLDPGDSGYSSAGATVCFVDPKERELKTAQRQRQRAYITNYLSSMARSLTGSNWRNPVLGYASFIDVTNWIDFHVLEVLSGNVDALQLSTYFCKPRSGKLQFGPHWDFDRALGSLDGRDNNPRVWSTGNFFSSAWWSRLFTDKDFWQLWVDRWQHLRETEFSLSHINGLIDQLADEVREAQPREQRKWRVSPRGGSYQAEVNRMKSWLSNRIDFIDRQLAQPPKFGLPAGVLPPAYSVSITAATNAAIYFTLDGSDPRAAQGGVATSARIYTGPIGITNNARITARAQDNSRRQSGGPPTGSSTPWSAPITSVYLVSPLSLLITEIMFHPEPPGSPYAASDFEFIELLNTGTNALSLAGVRLSGGVDFNYPNHGLTNFLGPGERTLLVRNRLAFQSRYGSNLRLDGEFSGSLGNDSNQLILSGPFGELLDEVTYHGSWSPLANGLGFSLTRTDEASPTGMGSAAGRWRASYLEGGSPAQAEPLPRSEPRVYLNEIMPNPTPGQQDAVELYNSEVAAADVSGWWLTDDFYVPRKIRLPAGSVIGARGARVFTAELFKVAGAVGFGLSQFGDEVFLFSADIEGRLTGWYHGCKFGPQSDGLTCQRWLSSDGRELWVNNQVESLGQTNASPAVGPIVISEIVSSFPILSATNIARGEFIELCRGSTESTPLRLGDAAQPDSVWALRGSVSYEFPAGFEWPTNRFVVVVGFDPWQNGAALAEFRERYLIDDTVTILGPWHGYLPDTGGTVSLIQTAQVFLSAGQDSTATIELETVDYSCSAPWPLTKPNSGDSLTRINFSRFGNDPSNWQQRSPTAGDMDSDQDGLPDRWELANTLDPFSGLLDQGQAGDPDQDGFSNREEYIAGTRAYDRASYLQLQVRNLANGQIELSFEGGACRSYSIVAADSLSDGIWREVARVSAPTTGGLMVYHPSITNSARFYRLSARGLIPESATE
jgi:hypothetical protein